MTMDTREEQARVAHKRLEQAIDDFVNQLRCYQQDISQVTTFGVGSVNDLAATIKNHWLPDRVRSVDYALTKMRDAS